MFKIYVKAGVPNSRSVFAGSTDGTAGAEILRQKDSPRYNISGLPLVFGWVDDCDLDYDGCTIWCW
jgi:hypothetical protein